MIDMVPFSRQARLLGAALICLVAAPAYDQDSSPWVVEAHSSARLLAGSRNGAVLLGGLDRFERFGGPSREIVEPFRRPSRMPAATGDVTEPVRSDADEPGLHVAQFATVPRLEP